MKTTPQRTPPRIRRSLAELTRSTNSLWGRLKYGYLEIPCAPRSSCRYISKRSAVLPLLNAIWNGVRHKFFIDLALALSLLLPGCALFALVLYRKWRDRHVDPPQAEKLLHPPGYSLSVKLDKHCDELPWDCCVTMVLSVIAEALAQTTAVAVNVVSAPWVVLLAGLFFGCAAIAGLCVIRTEIMKNNPEQILCTRMLQLAHMNSPSVAAALQPAPSSSVFEI